MATNEHPTKAAVEYSHYKDFIKDRFEGLRARDPKMTFRAFAKLAGMKSSNFILLVIQGKKNISAASIPGVSKALGLSKEEMAFLKSLVQLNHAGTIEEKIDAAEKLLETKMYKKAYPLSEAQFHYYTKWYYVAIREMVAFLDVEKEASNIAQRLEIKTSEVREAFEELKKLSLIKQQPDGTWTQTEGYVQASTEVFSPVIANYHMEMIRLAERAIEKWHRSQRDISCLTLGVSVDKIDEIKEIIAKFRREIMTAVEKEKDRDSVVQLNIQLFPLMLSEKEKG